MRKILFPFIVVSMLAFTVGCATKANLPTGAVDSVDANANEILQPAHAFAAALTAAVQSTDPNVHITLTATQLTALEDLNKALNFADPLEQAYHALPNAANANALKAASATVSTDLSTVESGLSPSTIAAVTTAAKTTTK